MFRASSCPSSGAYQVQQQQQPLIYHRNVVIAVLLVVVSKSCNAFFCRVSLSVLGMFNLPNKNRCYNLPKRWLVQYLSVDIWQDMKHTQTYRADIPASLRQLNKDLLTERGVKIRTTTLKNKTLFTDHGAND
jgi:hypothetical protein